MRNGITAALLSLGLIACGGESSDSGSRSSQASIDTKFSQDFHGLQAAPTLTTTE